MKGKILAKDEIINAFSMVFFASQSVILHFSPNSLAVMVITPIYI